MSHELQNLMRRNAAAVSSRIGQNRWGTITSVRNTDTGYEARVMIQPEDVLSGWLPILSPMVGPNWGLVCPPVPGQQAFIAPDTGDARQGVILGLGYSTASMPPQPNNTPVTAGQFALQHKNGSYLIFDDTNVTLVTTGSLHAIVQKDLIADVAQDVSITAQGTITLTGDSGTGIVMNTGTVLINGALFVTDDITYVDGAHGTVDELRAAYDGHGHKNVQNGGGTSGTTNIPL